MCARGFAPPFFFGMMCARLPSQLLSRHYSLSLISSRIGASKTAETLERNVQDAIKIGFMLSLGTRDESSLFPAFEFHRWNLILASPVSHESSLLEYINIRTTYLVHVLRAATLPPQIDRATDFQTRNILCEPIKVQRVEAS